MKRQIKDVATRVYSYGTVPARIAPVKGEPEAIDQLRLAVRLWNVLVAIEHQRIAKYRAIMQDEVQERIDLLRHQLATARQEIRDRRKAARKRIDAKDLDAAIATAKSEMIVLIESHKASKKERHDLKRADLDKLQERATRNVKRARQAAARMGLFWGTYNDVVQRADAARKHGGELQFRRFSSEGTLAAQVMGGAQVARCVGTGGSHTFFQVDPPKAGQKWQYARMRIGSHADRSPVWLEIPVVYHRDIPIGAEIKSVSMTRRIVDRRPIWQLNVTATTPKPAAKTGDAVAVDIGWRLLPDGVRVGYWLDESGAGDQVLIPMSDIEQFRKADSLISICDKSRDEFLPALCAWVDGQDVPEAWRKRSSHLSQWKSTDRLADLIDWWRENRLPGDGEMYLASQEWRKQYLHLIQWARNLRSQMVLRVREQYRVFAAGVARRYGTLVIERFDLREVIEKYEAEQAGEGRAPHKNRQNVSPSVFRMALVNACQREGVAVIKVGAEYSTRTCHACGCFAMWDQAESVMHRCKQCSEVWDQDRNAAINLLRAASGGAVMAGDAPEINGLSVEGLDRSQVGV